MRWEEVGGGVSEMGGGRRGEKWKEGRRWGKSAENKSGQRWMGVIEAGRVRRRQEDIWSGKKVEGGGNRCKEDIRWEVGKEEVGRRWYVPQFAP